MIALVIYGLVALVLMLWAGYNSFLDSNPDSPLLIVGIFLWPMALLVAIGAAPFAGAYWLGKFLKKRKGNQ